MIRAVCDKGHSSDPSKCGKEESDGMRTEATAIFNSLVLIPSLGMLAPTPPKAV